MRKAQGAGRVPRVIDNEQIFLLSSAYGGRASQVV